MCDRETARQFHATIIADLRGGPKCSMQFGYNDNARRANLFRMARAYRRIFALGY